MSPHAIALGRYAMFDAPGSLDRVEAKFRRRSRPSRPRADADMLQAIEFSAVGPDPFVVSEVEPRKFAEIALRLRSGRANSFWQLGGTLLFCRHAVSPLTEAREQKKLQSRCIDSARDAQRSGEECMAHNRVGVRPTRVLPATVALALSAASVSCGIHGSREADVRDAADRVVAALSGVYVGDVRTSGCPFEGQIFELHVDVDRDSLECQDDDAAASCDRPVDSGHMSVVLSVWVGETTFVHEDGFVSVIPDGYDDPSTHVIPGLPAGWPEIVRASAHLDRLGPDAKLEELWYGAAADAFLCGFFVTAPP